MLVVLSAAPAPTDELEPLRKDAAAVVAHIPPPMQAISQGFGVRRRLMAVGRAVATIDAASTEKPNNISRSSNKLGRLTSATWVDDR